jgi:hypothetical protein
MSPNKCSLTKLVFVLIAIGLLTIPAFAAGVIQQRNDPVSMPVVKPWPGFPTNTRNYSNPVDMYQAVTAPSTLPSFQMPADFISPGFVIDTSAPGKFHEGMKQSEIKISTVNANNSFIPVNTYLTVWNLANHGVSLSDYDYNACRNTIANEFYQKLILPI